MEFCEPKEASVSGSGIVSITTERPDAPAGASFALVIEFEKGARDPGRVFRAADAMIRSFQELDHTLCASVDPKIEPIMLLEDIEAGSIKAWLGQALTLVEDDALKTLDWKPLVGRYLVRAKYAVIRWSNQEAPGLDLLGLARELATIASETDVKHMPDYAPPALQSLASTIKQIDAAKDVLGPGDGMLLEGPDSGPIRFNLSVRWDQSELENLAIKEKTRFDKIPMTLIVKRPDYLGNSKWDFRLGKKPISAKIEDVEWLHYFQTRNVDVRPGDALRCLVTVEHSYGFDNELINEEHVVTKVEGVLANQLKQSNLDL